ncbi:MAG: chemotaxis response regulator protein-glutamate methylesterase [Alphaproteobacteria bacterium]|nr:chemotaxis response regulator protein-glutamate methylesterase [Alphaproteobacteria bacterium]
MVVDDSAVIRGFLTRFIESDPDIKVVSSAANGQLAVSTTTAGKFDVIVLDIEMPVMDGITALPLLLKADPNVQIIIASTLSKANAAITLRAFEAGAAECLAKPTSQELAGSNDFRNNLVQKVRSLGLLARKKRGIPERPPAAPAQKAAVPAAAQPKRFALRSEIVRPTPDVIAIGSSTGGPQALLQFFTDLKGPVRQPVFVTQHMPPTFTTILAEHISRQSGLDCREARDGESVTGGRIYLAPGNFHMTVKEQGGQKIIALNQDAQENFCRPAVDPMLRSLIGAYGKKILAVIFTGMGADGMKACQQLVEAGGTVLAQDEATSVVWGMPGAVAMAGLCTQVLPLGAMGRAVREYADRGSASLATGGPL